MSIAETSIGLLPYIIFFCVIGYYSFKSIIFMWGFFWLIPVSLIESIMNKEVFLKTISKNWKNVIAQTMEA